MIAQPSLLDFQQIIASFYHFMMFAWLAGVTSAAVMIAWGWSGDRSIRIPISLGAILGLGLAIRIPLFLHGFWYDETFSSALIALPWSDMFIAISGDVHPPGYYVLLKIITSVFAHNDLVMRFPALIAGLALVWVFYHISLDLIPDENTARLSALIIALLPATAYYSTEARYPVMLALMFALGWLGYRKQQPLLFAIPLMIAAWLHINAWVTIGLFILLWWYRHRTISPTVASIRPGISSNLRLDLLPVADMLAPTLD